MDLQSLIDLVIAHQWWAVASVVVGLLVRYSKSDTFGPVVPARYRPALALGLGVLSACLEKIASGAPWAYTLVGGVLSAAVAVLGHGLIVDGVRGGVELPVPGAIAPSPAAPSRGFVLGEVLPMIAGAVIAVTLLAGALHCGPSSKVNAVVPHDVRVLAECAAADAALRAHGIGEGEIALAHLACVAVAQKYGAALARDAGAAPANSSAPLAGSR